MRIMIPKVKCSECSKKMYINAVPRAYPSGGEMIYICEQCKNESDRNKEVNLTRPKGLASLDLPSPPQSWCYVEEVKSL